MNETLQNIQKAVSWYDRLPADFNDIQMLLNARRLLSTRLFQLAGYLADQSRDKIAAEHVRKSFEARRFAEIKSTSEGKVIAAHIDAQVRSEAVEYAQKEAQAEADYTALKIIYSAAQNVCDVMSQHISNLKQERFSESVGAGSQAT